MNNYLSFTNSHLSIKYHLTFTKPFYKWLMTNNLANGKRQMENDTGGAR